MKGYCIVCDTEIDVQMCCSGYECGCLGQPIDPPVCGENCYGELLNNFDKYYPKSSKVSIDIDENYK